MNQVTSFKIDVQESQLDDLRRRLNATRWPEAATVSDWSQGIPLDYLREVCAYWAQDYDWRERERRINALPQFKTDIDGLGIHFIHVRSPHADARPLILTHGWPGSVVEFLNVIGPLTDPERHGGAADEAFHVVAPALPGFGFSDKPDKPGWGVSAIAAAWVQLMQRLGYERFYAQGGDWGAAVTSAIGALHADCCLGIHVNMPVVPMVPAQGEALSADEEDGIAALAHYQKYSSGYMAQQMTRPQTIGYGLVDSPVGLAGWILEKFWCWCDCNGQPEMAVSRDELLDNVMFYWLTASAASSARLYWENAASLFQILSGEISGGPGYYIDVPSGISRFPGEIMKPSRRWAERRYRNLVYFNKLDRGGHFAAFEQPQTFVSELRACFRQMG
ncbi:MAG: epoxide hydrolase [Salinisphaera sp.]|nr:epoxide hydrolase [Salinisphaera sp.]